MHDRGPARGSGALYHQFLRERFAIFQALIFRIVEVIKKERNMTASENIPALVRGLVSDRAKKVLDVVGFPHKLNMENNSDEDSG
jgi:hypothetical protein